MKKIRQKKKKRMKRQERRKQMGAEKEVEEQMNLNRNMTKGIKNMTEIKDTKLSMIQINLPTVPHAKAISGLQETWISTLTIIM